MPFVSPREHLRELTALTPTGLLFLTYCSTTEEGLLFPVHQLFSVSDLLMYVM